MSGAHIAIQAAEAQRRRLQEEEERMTNYTKDELERDWEFKIIRCSTNKFKNPEIFRRLVEEEGLAGWELLEKLDNSRIRFKRLTSARKRDPMLPSGMDPYRTQFGVSEAMVGMRIFFLILLVVGAVITFIVLAENGGTF